MERDDEVAVTPAAETPATETPEAPAGWRAQITAEKSPPVADEAETDETTDELPKGESEPEVAEGEELSDDEKMAELRREAGVPDDSSGYELPEIEGHEWTKADEPILEAFFPLAHELGLPPDRVDALVTFVVEQGKAQQEVAEQARNDVDAADLTRVVSTLKADWGADYEANIGSLSTFLKSFGDLGDAIVDARMPDGRLLRNHEAFATTFAKLAKGEQPSATPNPRASAARLREIEKALKTDASDYFRRGLDREHLELKRKIEGAETAPVKASAPVAKIEAELAKIQKVMKSDMRKYWKDGLDVRHLELTRQLEAAKAPQKKRA